MLWVARGKDAGSAHTHDGIGGTEDATSGRQRGQTGPGRHNGAIPNVYRPQLENEDGYRRARLGEHAGAEALGLSLYELAPGEKMVFHYHVQREELMIVIRGSVAVRTADGWEDLPEGEVVAFPRGERGAHGYKNKGTQPVRLLMVSEMNGPNISVYPDTNQVGVFDAGPRTERRFGALFNVSDAVADYAGKAELVPPASGPRGNIANPS
jgi:uncharacterized cupin superfamily protein